MNPEAPTSPFREFDLRERNAASGDDRADAARVSLRAAVPVPTDTFVTGDLPLLLTRMSGLAAVASSSPTRTGD